MDEEKSKLIAVKLIQTADEEAALKSITLVTLDNNTTLLFILDNSALKIGMCCWPVLFSIFPACVNKKKEWTKGGQAPSQCRLSILSFIIALPSR